MDIFKGFEVVVAGRKYFAFSKYEYRKKQVASICDEVFPGWSHDTSGKDWACYTANKTARVPVKIEDIPASRYDTVFIFIFPSVL